MILSIVREHCFYPWRPSNHFSSALDKIKVQVAFQQKHISTKAFKYIHETSQDGFQTLFSNECIYLENYFVIFGVKQKGTNFCYYISDQS